MNSLLKALKLENEFLKKIKKIIPEYIIHNNKKYTLVCSRYWNGIYNCGYKMENYDEEICKLSPWLFRIQNEKEEDCINQTLENLKKYKGDKNENSDSSE